MSYFRRSDGRLLVRVPLPRDIIDRAAQIAESCSRELSDVLGDMAVAELPEILYEAAAELLAPDLALNAEVPPVLTSGTPKDVQPDVVPQMISEDDDSTHEDSSGGPPT